VYRKENCLFKTNNLVQVIHSLLHRAGNFLYKVKLDAQQSCLFGCIISLSGNIRRYTKHTSVTAVTALRNINTNYEIKIIASQVNYTEIRRFNTAKFMARKKEGDKKIKCNIEASSFLLPTSHIY